MQFRKLVVLQLLLLLNKLTNFTVQLVCVQFERPENSLTRDEKGTKHRAGH